MTCNPNWAEVKDNLLHGQTASDRPDIVLRIFNANKDELINIKVKQQFIGEVQAYSYVFEHQKCGLHHVHLLLTLKQNSKLTTSNIVDECISAEILNPDTDPELHNIVIENMIHGPCGDWCKDGKGKCSKYFLKKFHDETRMDENGYPTYRRTDTGHDAASVVVTDANNSENVIHHDAIKNCIDTRYVSPFEACERIYCRSLQNKRHAVIRLPVHLPNQQIVTIGDAESEGAIRNALENETMVSLTQHEQLGQTQQHTLNGKQKDIVHTILNVALSNEEGLLKSCFYIDGPGGSGKT
ncbi:uncharacterized protein LOC117173552 [Belonocnema kinseyi]|uniref:uncharacterized protein LOC117173552 n=1 Tax=Belonocnema kinseyi TaxID=2817044 RepID=UPI00143D321B|nr:uncharacterized protein LOC117173552 [Belonocnema kinseyi]